MCVCVHICKGVQLNTNICAMHSNRIESRYAWGVCVYMYKECMHLCVRERKLERGEKVKVGLVPFNRAGVCVCVCVCYGIFHIASLRTGTVLKATHSLHNLLNISWRYACARHPSALQGERTQKKTQPVPISRVPSERDSKRGEGASSSTVAGYHHGDKASLRQ